MTDRKTRKRSPFRLSIHPLFLLTGIWYSFTGQLPLFFISALVALQHECAHAFAAARLGYRLDKVVLMPYGAVIDGDLTGITFKDEIFVAVCGPLVNLATAALFVALWWVWPTLYAYTDTACYSSLFIALLNLLPSYPLDGGRILMSLLQQRFIKTKTPAAAHKKARLVCLVLSLSFASGFLALFIILCVNGQTNLTLLAFSVFLAAGGIGHLKEKACYQKIDYSFKSAFRRGVMVRHIAVDEHCTLKHALRFLDEKSYVAFEIYDKQEQFLGTLTQNSLAENFQTADIYQTLASLLPNGE